MGNWNYTRKYMSLETDWNTKEGVFKGLNGKYLVRIRRGDNKTFTTVSQHATEDEAIERFNQLLKENYEKGG
jgi:hypothetical protein